MDPLGDLQTTCPIQTGSDNSTDPYSNSLFRPIDHPVRQFATGVVPTSIHNLSYVKWLFQTQLAST